MPYIIYYSSFITPELYDLGSYPLQEKMSRKSEL